MALCWPNSIRLTTKWVQQFQWHTSPASQLYLLARAKHTPIWRHSMRKPLFMLSWNKNLLIRYACKGNLNPRQSIIWNYFLSFMFSCASVCVNCLLTLYICTADQYMNYNYRCQFSANPPLHPLFYSLIHTFYTIQILPRSKTKRNFIDGKRGNKNKDRFLLFLFRFHVLLLFSLFLSFNCYCSNYTMSKCRLCTESYIQRIYLLNYSENDIN